MRRYLLTPLILFFFQPVQADETCLFISQYEPDLMIEVSTKEYSQTSGYLNYKGSPIFRFSTGIRKGYGGQYFSISNMSDSLDFQDKNIVYGSVITIVGDQSAMGTPKSERKQGLTKVFFPNFGLNYYYSLATDVNSLDSSFERRTKKIDSILSAAEGFWIPSEICKKYVLGSW